MSKSKSEIIQRIHGNSSKVSLLLAGGGTNFVNDLLTEPGASRTILDLQIPYSESSMIRFWAVVLINLFHYQWQKKWLRLLILVVYFLELTEIQF